MDVRTRAMNRVLLLLWAGMIAAMLLSNGAAAQGACLGAAQARAAIQSGQARPLAAALNSAGLNASKVARARLCRGGRGLVYRLTLNNGKRISVPAN